MVKAMREVMWLRMLACAVLLVAWGLAVSACSRSSSQPVTLEASGLVLSVSVEPADLRVGKNEMLLELRDEAGDPVAGADVAVRVHMHAMGAMPAMGGPARVREIAPGQYRATFTLAMGSTWNVGIVASAADGRVVQGEGSLTVGTPGVRLEGVALAAAPAAPEGASAPSPSASPRAPAAAAQPAEFQIAPGRLQRIGVRSARAETRPVATTIRAVGRVVAEETTLADVSLKIEGWVREVFVDAVGDPVTQGEVLFTLYSPELYAAQQEYLQALRSQQRARTSSAPDRADYLVRSARNRLRLWDIADADLERLAHHGEPLEQLPIRAPVSGFVIDKDIALGSAVSPGQRLYRIAPLSRVWVEAEIYEYELPRVHVGQRATVSLAYRSDSEWEGEVAYVYPTLDPRTRTAKLRIELPNPDLVLRPEMYATVALHAERGDRLMVPQSAVLYAGERSFVFRALGEGRFRPQAVTTGLRAGEELEILSGIAPGDEIVTSGTFLIASESRLRAALSQW